MGNNGGCDRERAQCTNYSVFNFMYVTSDFFHEKKAQISFATVQSFHLDELTDRDGN